MSSILFENEDNASLTVYLVGILAEQISSCSVYEVLRGWMLGEYKICLPCPESHHPCPSPLSQFMGGTPPAGCVPSLALAGFLICAWWRICEEGEKRRMMMKTLIITLL